MASPTPSITDLDEFLSTQRLARPGHCPFCDVPQEIRDIVSQRVELKAWAAFSRFVVEQGYPQIRSETIKQHYVRNHDA